jgi:hypothetical protein
MKKSRFRMPEYSVAKPATSSDSASGRSNGVRFPSASAETKNTKNATNVNGFAKRFHENGPAPCCVMISCIDSEPVRSTIGKIESPAGISYEMICAAERMPPKSDHLLFDAQPAIRMPTTTSAVTDVT